MDNATPSPQTAQIQEWMADLDALLSRVEASRDYPYRGGDLVDCRATAIIHLHQARRWLIADLGHQRHPLVGTPTSLPSDPPTTNPS